jgi:hypothetical protein
MDSKQDMQATGATRGQSIISLPRTPPRPQPHQGGGGQQTPLCAVYVHSLCAVRCLSHGPTAPWTPGRTCRLPGPPGDSPPAACHGPHHALNRTGVATGRLTLYAPCMSTVPVQCGACPMTPPHHGQQAGHAGYRGHQGTVHHQPATDHTTPSTAPEWLRPADATMRRVCPQSLCSAVPTPSPARHGPHYALNRTRVAADRLTLCDTHSTYRLCPRRGGLPPGETDPGGPTREAGLFSTSLGLTPKLPARCLS